MKYIISIIFFTALFFSCNSSKPQLHNVNTFKIEEYSNDPTYGYSIKNPIKVGGVEEGIGVINERRFLNALVGPNREAVYYERLGSVSNGGNELTRVLLDKYKITYEGLEEEIILYINMYKSSKLKVPVGFKLRYDD